MQLTFDLHLKTREVYKLFELKISDTRFFMAEFLQKINRIDLVAQEIQLQIEQDLRSLIAEFSQKTACFEKMLDNNKNIRIKSINVSTQFHTKIIITNKLGILLVEFIERYDSLIALIKLLHLSGYFDSKQAYYINRKHVKKMGNKMLSKLLLLSKQYMGSQHS